MKLTILRMITSILILLFFYTAVAKLMDLNTFEKELSNQTLPGWSVPALLWLIPAAELLTVCLLLSPAARHFGFSVSAFLMFLFTSYMGLVLLNVFERVPCSCGGVLKGMGFRFHFIFNLFFFLLSLAGAWLMRFVQQPKHLD